VSDCEHIFRCMGTDVRLLWPDRAGLEDASAWLASFDARLSRFRPASELCALNADRRPAMPTSALLRAAVRAALWAARQTGGLVDPTVLPALRRAGYARSLAVSRRRACRRRSPRRRRAAPRGRTRAAPGEPST
jgi:FAD:protein FMN transferase